MEKSRHPIDLTELSPPPPYNPVMASSSSGNNFAVPMIHFPGGLNQAPLQSGGTSQITIREEQPNEDLLRLTSLIGHHDRFILKQTDKIGKEMYFVLKFEL